MARKKALIYAVSQGVELAGYQNILDRFLIAHIKKYFSYLRSSYKFHHMQVLNGTKNGTFGAMSQVEKLGLVGYQNFLRVMSDDLFENFGSYLTCFLSILPFVSEI